VATQPSTPEATKLRHLREAVRHLEAAGLKTEAKQIHVQIEKLQNSELRKELKQKEEQLKKLHDEVSRLRQKVGDRVSARRTSYRPKVLPRAYYLKDDVQFFPAGPAYQWLNRLRVDHSQEQPPKRKQSSKKRAEQSQVMIHMKVLSVSPEKLKELGIDFATLTGADET